MPISLPPPPEPARRIAGAAALARLVVEADGRAMTVLSPDNAGGVLGAGWWLALIAPYRHLPLRFVLDCGAHTGIAVEALRAGVPAVAVTAAAPSLEALQGYAAACGAEVFGRLADAAVSGSA